MIRRQAVLLKQVNTRFHMLLCQFQLTGLLIQTAKVCMEIRCKKGVLCGHFGDQRHSFFFQLDCLFRFLLISGTEVQKQSTVRNRTNGIVFQHRSQFCQNQFHSRFIAILLHIRKGIFQKPEIGCSIVIFNRSHDIIDRLEQLFVIGNFFAMP